MKFQIEYCQCETCLESDRPCSFDCDIETRCEGCEELAIERSEVELESKCVMGVL